MMTREKKWARYRRRIEKMGDSSSFAPEIEVEGKDGDSDVIALAMHPAIAIDSSSLGIQKPNLTLFNIYKKHQKLFLIIRFILLALSLAAFILLWVLWVNGGK